MTQQTATPDEARGAFSDALTRLAQKLGESTSLRQGDIVLRLSGTAGGNYSVQCRRGAARVVESAAAGTDRPPLIEVMGDSDTIRAILDGQQDARQQFLAGGIRVRGDLRYLSDLALELGVLKAPL